MHVKNTQVINTHTLTHMMSLFRLKASVQIESGHRDSQTAHMHIMLTSDSYGHCYHGSQPGVLYLRGAQMHTKDKNLLATGTHTCTEIHSWSQVLSVHQKGKYSLCASLRYCQGMVLNMHIFLFVTASLLSVCARVCVCVCVRERE